MGSVDTIPFGIIPHWNREVLTRARPRCQGDVPIALGRIFATHSSTIASKRRWVTAHLSQVGVFANALQNPKTYRVFVNRFGGHYSRVMNSPRFRRTRADWSRRRVALEPTMLQASLSASCIPARSAADRDTNEMQSRCALDPLPCFPGCGADRQQYVLQATTIAIGSVAGLQVARHLRESVHAFRLRNERRTFGGFLWQSPIGLAKRTESSPPPGASRASERQVVQPNRLLSGRVPFG